MKKEVPLIIMGAKDMPNKVGIAYKDEKLSGVTVSICEMEAGKKGVLPTGFIPNNIPTSELIEGEYVKLHFCKRNSLQAFIDLLFGALDMFDEQSERNDID